MSPKAHIRHLQQAQIAQKMVQIEVRKEVEAFRANKAKATEENLNEMLDSNEARRSAHSQSQASLLEELLQISSSGIKDSLRWSFGSPPNTKEDFNQDKQVALRKLLNQHQSVGECVKKLMNMASGKKYCEAYKLGTQLNDEMGRTFCCLSGWFESLEVEDYKPFDWEESKGKRKADGCPE
ncbi:hypothetical protein PPACK8108_LOCUS19167 [Phakopsora pachyrhizi]|uniref:Uncharacterized protein n=1 Tax=Phakopsora pachyrhizi TaxID=170000 RepID=A0AAV0BFD2_PHAPC|nr:hypothetical protein PPACK8108_LOCUS19167 [Phakopsora pachyrhizi]